MKLIHGKVPFIAVPVPGDAKDYRYKIMPDDTKQLVGTIYAGQIKGTVYVRDNPQGTILGKLSELTEEQCAELVEFISSERHIFYKDYDPFSKDNYIYGAAKESLKSLLQSNGLNLKSWVVAPKVCVGLDLMGAIIQQSEYEQRLSEAAEDYLIILID
jgi:hypothetical protein